MIKNVNVNFSAKNGEISKILAHKIVGLLKTDLNFNIISLPINIISANQIKQINKKYLNHDYSTDIITFNYSGNTANLDGEIFISAEDAYFNAKKFGVTFADEILRLIIHGILHLVGYDDKNHAEKQKMKQIEDKLFNKYKTIFDKELNDFEELK